MKWFKKNRFNLFTYLFCAFAMALFTIISFSCKTYAYTINDDGNLVGDNLCSDSWTYNENGDFSQYNNVHDYDINSMLNINGEYTFSIYFNQDLNNLLAIELRRNYNYAHSVGSSDLYGRLSLTFNFNTNDIVQIRIYTTYGTAGSKSVQFYNSMLNSGNTAQNWEPYGVWYSETNYDTLENQYNDLNNTYQKVLQENQYGFFNYVGSVLFRYTYLGEIAQVRLLKSTLINQGILLNGGIFNPNAIAESDTITGAVNFSFDLETGAPWEAINFYLMENENYVVNIQIEDDEENTINITKSHSNDILDNYVTPNEIYSKFLESGVNNLDVIIRISFNFQSFDTSARVVSANNGSYNLGYQEGAQFYKNNYYNALRQITLDNNEINRLKQNLALLQSSYNDLNQSYQNSLNGNNFANLFFTIAETPFASFKQIWSVDFLGVNLAGFVTGILFIGVLIWVVKKIF